MAKYIWYSGATDITGKALGEALGLTGTKTRPRNLSAGDIVLGWGTKTNENVNLAGTILNHPNKIKDNRDKLKSLSVMKANRDLAGNIATFCASNRVVRELDAGNMVLPLVGRTKFHQGGKGFWLCLTRQHIDKAISDGAQYFQTYIDILDEYRLHVAFGKVIYAVKKVENPTDAGWIAQRKEKVLDYASKNNVNLTDATVDYVLGILVKEAALPDRIVRSNKRGWKFSSVQINNLPAALKNAAIKSVEVAGLDFGAVDCAMSANNLPFIIEINSGPGLQGTALQKYIEDFTAKIAELERPVRANPVRRAAAAVGGAARRAVGADNAAPAAAPAVEAIGMARIMQNVRTDAEAQAVIAVLMAERR
jgi:glutathione synthase/RimK-type ligase-like ATP-grasp enzyme